MAITQYKNAGNVRLFEVFPTIDNSYLTGKVPFQKSMHIWQHSSISGIVFSSLSCSSYDLPSITRTASNRFLFYARTKKR
jgi:hypothetical protein